MHFQVVANAVAALAEINESHILIEINSQTINKLLTALNECTEWGQVFILDALSLYQPKDEREAQKFAFAASFFSKIIGMKESVCLLEASTNCNTELLLSFKTIAFDFCRLNKNKINKTI